ncbi:bifunctional 2',3'-cyclic-nucleotide 2'-phosphodiesterase/3'-nucleotidase [Dokdonella soli]|uniref:Bifunctional 2',3'-cyclic-nucleotide 2'-phosphodiesterase/3'-nucleotidase n=1 Tax=Dokdonella soli TaxID=529810 RepID=A0ABN1IEB7_9GAMM
MPLALRISVCLSILLVGACASTPPHPRVADGTHARLAILESTDIHSNILSFDYYRVAADPSLGFERMATLVRQARTEFPNTLLFDAGDTIQGTALADYQALVKPVGCGEELAMYRVMDALGYDGGTIGNHEFNYGLPYLAQVTGRPMNAEGVASKPCAGPHYPLVLSNVFSARDNQPIYPPYAVLDRTLKLRDANGRETEAPIRIGIIGFTPPLIMDWDKRNLEGKVTTKGLVEAAREYLPKLRAQSVDLVIAISHGGLDVSPYGSTMENANWYLSQEPGIDALLLGHSHVPFPDPGNAKSRFANLPDVDNQRGFVHGKPTVMDNFWGKSLGVIDLALVRRDGRWQIDPAATHSEVRDIRKPDGSFVAPDPQIAQLVQQTHEATIAYVSQPIGDSDFAMTTYFADVGDVTALQPVNAAQHDYAKRYIEENLPQYKDVPLLSAAAPFKGGFGGANDYTDIPAGPLAIRHAADLYLYPNTLTAVKIDGAILKRWLERAAERFNRIDPAKAEAQELINRKFSGYNFDVIQNGLTYAIDVTQPAGSRIRELRYRGKPVDPAQPFIVVTNNYRASGGGHFPGLDGSNIVLSAPDANRDVLIEWVKQHRHLTRAEDGANRNWRFVPVTMAGPVIFTSAAGKLDLARRAGLGKVRQLMDNGDGSAIYAVDFPTP